MSEQDQVAAGAAASPGTSPDPNDRTRGTTPEPAPNAPQEVTPDDPISILTAAGLTLASADDGAGETETFRIVLRPGRTAERLASSPDPDGAQSVEWESLFRWPDAGDPADRQAEEEDPYRLYHPEDRQLIRYLRTRRDVRVYDPEEAERLEGIRTGRTVTCTPPVGYLLFQVLEWLVPKPRLLLEPHDDALFGTPVSFLAPELGVYRRPASRLYLAVYPKWPRERPFRYPFEPYREETPPTLYTRGWKLRWSYYEDPDILPHLYWERIDPIQRV